MVDHTGDNLTGEGDGDDEQVNVCLLYTTPSPRECVSVVYIYHALRRNQQFG
ncbi:TerD family protein, partial [Bacillus pumilus]|uniref:TerD family protein n=1 Tax=Bacillus pumilus TaxID=1408 RepID=UPI001646CE4C